MIHPLSIHDNSKPLVVQLNNKKAGGGNYVSSAGVVGGNSMDMQTSSISLSKTFGLVGGAGKQAVVVLQGGGSSKNNNSCQEEESGKTSNRIGLMLRDGVCFMYILFTVLGGVCSLVIPYYMTHVFIVLSPLFALALAIHAMILGTSLAVLVAVTVGNLYSLAIVLPGVGIDTAACILFIFMCSLSLRIRTMGCLKISLVGVLMAACLSGLLVYQVYPRSVHGIHATFLSTCILACVSVFLVAKKQYYLCWDSSGCEDETGAKTDVKRNESLWGSLVYR